MKQISAARAGAASTPRYLEIHKALRQKIVSGNWPPGYKLPPEPALAKSFNCARMTISKALGTLADRGLISRRRRAGTTVSTPRAQESVLEIHDIESEVLAAGHAYRYECLRREARHATQREAEALHIVREASVLVLRGLHWADGRPHALEERLINLDAVPDARRERFVKISPGRWLLSRVPWTDAEHEISAISADRLSAQQLEVTRGSACLCIERRTWLGKRRITYVKLLYPGDQHRLVARFHQVDH